MDDERYQLSWISYDEFNDITQIGKGGFATVYVAGWLDKGQNNMIDVALKIIDNSEEFINEVNQWSFMNFKNIKLIYFQ